MISQMIQDDSSRTDFNPSTNRIWNQSLCRSVTATIVNIFQMIVTKETNQNQNSGQMQASPFCKQSFYSQLATTMNEFRRSPGDSSPAIIWTTSETKRYGTQFSNRTWSCKPALLDIVGRIIPVVSPNRRNREIEEVAMKKIRNSFFDRISQGQKVSLNILAIRVMVFMKKAREEKDGVVYDKPRTYRKDWVNDYELTEDIKLRDFFFCDETYLAFCKNSYNTRSGDLLGSRRSNPTGYCPVGAKDNEADWDTSDGGRISTMLKYDSKGQAGKDGIAKLHQFIREGKETEAHELAFKNLIFTRTYVEYLHDLFTAYKEEIIQELRDDMDGTIRKYKKVCNRKAGMLPR